MRPADTNMASSSFPTVYWPAWDADATFFPGTQLPLESEGGLYAVLVFLFYGDKCVLADIVDRGMCIPSGRIEPGETIDQAAVRECFEETGALLHEQSRTLIGCYRMTTRSGAHAGQVRWNPVFVAEALGFRPLPAGSESRGMFLAAVEDVADVYFFWDELVASVFDYAEAERQKRFPPGISLSALTEQSAP